MNKRYVLLHHWMKKVPLVGANYFFPHPPSTYLGLVYRCASCRCWLWLALPVLRIAFKKWGDNSLSLLVGTRLINKHLLERDNNNNCCCWASAYGGISYCLPLKFPSLQVSCKITAINWCGPLCRMPIHWSYFALDSSARDKCYCHQMVTR